MPTYQNLVGGGGGRHSFIRDALFSLSGDLVTSAAAAFRASTRCPRSWGGMP